LKTTRMTWRRKIEVKMARKTWRQEMEVVVKRTRKTQNVLGRAHLGDYGCRPILPFGLEVKEKKGHPNNLFSPGF
jgi:hypothetical protein